LAKSHAWPGWSRAHLADRRAGLLSIWLVLTAIRLRCSPISKQAERCSTMIVLGVVGFIDYLIAAGAYRLSAPSTNSDEPDVGRRREQRSRQDEAQRINARC
jgi:hypothetical protein